MPRIGRTWRWASGSWSVESGSSSGWPGSRWRVDGPQHRPWGDLAMTRARAAGVLALGFALWLAVVPRRDRDGNGPRRPVPGRGRGPDRRARDIVRGTDRVSARPAPGRRIRPG